MGEVSNSLRLPKGNRPGAFAKWDERLRDPCGIDWFSRSCGDPPRRPGSALQTQASGNPSSPTGYYAQKMGASANCPPRFMIRYTRASWTLPFSPRGERSRARFARRPSCSTIGDYISKKSVSSSSRYFFAPSGSMSRPSPGASSTSIMESLTISSGSPMTISSHQGSEALGYSKAM